MAAHKDVRHATPSPTSSALDAICFDIYAMWAFLEASLQNVYTSS